MHRWFFFVGFLWLGQAAWGQSASTVDSLRNLLQQDLADTSRLKALQYLAYYEAEEDPVGARLNAQEALKLSLRILNQEEEAMSRLALGYAAYHGQDYPLARIQYDSALLISQLLHLEHVKAMSLFGLGRVCEAQDQFGQSRAYFERALALTTPGGVSRMRARIFYHVGRMYRFEGLFAQARPYLDSALVLEEHIGNTYRQAEILHLLAVVCSHQGQFVDGLDYSQRMLTLAEALNDHHLYAQCYRAFGHVYVLSGDMERAQEVFEKNLFHAEAEGSVEDIATVYSNIGSVHRKLGHGPEALAALNRSLAIYRELGQPRGTAFNLYELGTVHLNFGRYDSAQLYLEEAMALSQAMDSKRLMSAVSIEQGRLHLQFNRPYQAQRALEEALRMAHEMRKPEYARDAQQYLAEAYEAQGNWKAAVQARKEYQAMADSLLNRNLITQLAMAQAGFDFQRQKDELELARAREEFEYSMDLQQRKMAQVITFIALAICLLLAVVVGRSYVLKRKSHEELARLNQEIQSQNYEILQQRDDLEALVVAKDRLFSIISHDLRGPIHSISSLSGLVQMLLKQGKIDQLPELLDGLDRSSQQVSQLLDNLLSWAMQKQGLLSHKPQGLNLRKEIELTLSVFELKAQEKDIRLISEVSDALWVWADLDAFHTIVRNLISNALKFTYRHGTVRVEAIESDPHICISISDTGAGISQEQQSSLFVPEDKNVRLGTSGERGTGLGLPLVQEFVKRNQGTISLTSKEGEGSTFTVCLPAYEPMPEDWAELEAVPDSVTEEEQQEG